MNKVVQLTVFQTKLVDDPDDILEDNPDVFVLALTKDGSIFITQNPQLDMDSFDWDSWTEIDPPSGCQQ
tara:strand:- start:96 stop:302 length:207 start_codon:yes stop_codon:yes gene_type:complete